MSWVQELIEIARAADGRVAPTFGPHHIAVALTMIGREQPIGRYELCERMSVGEGSARTLLKRLKDARYIKAKGREGQMLTGKGVRLFEKITVDVPLGLKLDLREIVIHQHAFSYLVKRKASKVTDGLRQRDEAIIRGGVGKAGATTLIQKNGLLYLPPNDYNILNEYEHDALLITESLRVEDGDVVVIGSADSENLAREVSMAAVLTLFEE